MSHNQWIHNRTCVVVHHNHKKENSEPTDFENYRPLSDLAFTSKLTEKAANNQLHSFLDEEQLFHLDSQPITLIIPQKPYCLNLKMTFF
jgi:hypothetical protein